MNKSSNLGGNVPHNFDIISEITNIEAIARGLGVDARHYLNEIYGHGRWRKLKGNAWVRYKSGRVAYAEIHWFEAHGIGKVREKIARELRRRQ